MKNPDYDTEKASLLADIAKLGDERLAERAKQLLDAWEHYALEAKQSTSFSAHVVDTNQDVKRLTRVNAVAVLAMSAVAVVALRGRR